MNHPRNSSYTASVPVRAAVGNDLGCVVHREVMVSVDPARDTVEQLSTYVPYFHPEFLGVTGDFPDILSFARRFNAPFRKVTMEDGSYQMDHSANVVLINPKGDFHGFFRAPLDLAKMKVTLRSAQYYWSQQYPRPLRP